MTTRRYRIKTSPLFEREFKKLDPAVQKLIAKYIKNNLVNCENPREKGKALVANKKGLWRYRIADYRLICEINDEEIIIIVLNIGHRREIYR